MIWNGEAYSLATPSPQCLPIRTQIRINDLWYDILPQLPLKALPAEVGIHVLHYPQHLRSLVLVEPRTDRVCDGPETRNERVLGLVVSLF